MYVYSVSFDNEFVECGERNQGIITIVITNGWQFMILNSVLCPYSGRNNCAFLNIPTYNGELEIYTFSPIDIYIYIFFKEPTSLRI